MRWLYSLTRDQQYRRAVHAAHHSHLLGTNLWVQMTIPLLTREEGRLAILRRAHSSQTTPIPRTSGFCEKGLSSTTGSHSLHTDIAFDTPDRECTSQSAGGGRSTK